MHIDNYFCLFEINFHTIILKYIYFHLWFIADNFLFQPKKKTRNFLPLQKLTTLISWLFREEKCLLSDFPFPLAPTCIFLHNSIFKIIFYIFDKYFIYICVVHIWILLTIISDAYQILIQFIFTLWSQKTLNYKDTKITHLVSPRESLRIYLSLIHSFK